MIPEYDRMSVKIEIRMSARLRDEIEVLARFARARSVSDYLRNGIDGFLSREKKRLGLTEGQVSRGEEMLRNERHSTKKLRAFRPNSKLKGEQ